MLKYRITLKELRENKLLSQLQRFYHSVDYAVMFMGYGKVGKTNTS